MLMFKMMLHHRRSLRCAGDVTAGILYLPLYVTVGASGHRMRTSIKRRMKSTSRHAWISRNAEQATNLLLVKFVALQGARSWQVRDMIHGKLSNVKCIHWPMVPRDAPVINHQTMTGGCGSFNSAAATSPRGNTPKTPVLTSVGRAYIRSSLQSERHAFTVHPILPAHADGFRPPHTGIEPPLSPCR